MKSNPRFLTSLKPLTRLVPAALLAACGAATGDETDAEPETGTTAAAGTTASEETTAAPTTGAVDPDAVTYHGVARPILAKHCVSCHREGGIAPFALETYADAAQFSEMIAASTHARTMPPYPVDNSGACNTYRDARWLTDEEISALAAWDEQGALEGDPSTPAPEVVPPATLTGEVVTLAMQDDYVPNAAVADDYRCFVIPSPVAGEGEAFITGFDVRPGNPEIVHHVVVYAPFTADAGAQAEALDAGEPGAGYTCYGSAQVLAGIAVAWAPGGGATHFPPGAGVKLLPGAPLIVQMHYNNLAGAGMSDRTEVDLQVAPSVEKPARFVAVLDLGLELPPGQASVSTTNSSTVPGMNNAGPLELIGLFPHMHTLGRTLSLSLERGGETTCLMEVPRWDFHWQMLYFYEKAIALEPGDLLKITCSYDTTGRTEPTHWGEGTMDEMCIAGMFVADR